MIQIDWMINEQHLIQETFIGQLWQASDCSHRISEFTDFLSIYAMPRLGELLVATSLLLTASQEVNGTEDGGQNGKGTWSLLSIMCLQEFLKALLNPNCIYSCICGSSFSLRKNLISQHDAFGEEDHLYILPNILLFQDPHEGPQKCCIFKASVHTTMFNGWNSSWLQQYELQQISACKVGVWWIFWWLVTLGWIIKTTTFRKDHPRKEDFHHQLLHRTFQVLAPLALEVNIYVPYSKLLGAWFVTLVWNL